ncbi:hypothetical protein DICVIV_07694 [Dictyocaulus viviparus]|uniref:Uncharacterized protein n=1 Tax=Dictyocaulus viviparus TaxID=29172 RepID=A0A0D8XNQ6_DICVI|nr:hypothetical protein DICVIV_07694 [Dictyocaulus viviparus]
MLLKKSPSNPIQAASMGINKTEDQAISGWERLRFLYEQPSMERDLSRRIINMAFLTGFFFGGVATSAQARETFERSNIGQRFLSASDVLKRQADYAIVRFAKSGFPMGFKCALVSGSIVYADFLKIFHCG